MEALSFLPKHIRLVLAICLLYAAAWLSQFGRIPIGIHPSEDQVDILINVAAGNTSTLYAGILQSINQFCDSERALIQATRIIQTFALLLAALFCALTAEQFWKSERAACAAALLVGINPVILFRLGQITPTIFAVLCVSIFFWRFMRWIKRAHAGDTFIVGSALAIGVLLEPSLLTLVVIWPVAAFLYPTKNKGVHFVLGLIPPLVAAACVLTFNLELPHNLSSETPHPAAQIYSFFSNQEANDGISYAILHKLYFILFLNPIHWGLLLILTVGGVYARIKDSRRGISALALLIVLGLFLASYVFSNGGGQNRLALTPVLAVFSAGCFSVIPRIWKHAGTRTRKKIVTGLAGLATLTYTGYFLSSPKDDILRDNYVYMANACIEANQNKMALTWANRAIELSKNRPDMYNILVRAYFDNWATGNDPKPLSIEDVQEQFKAIGRGDPSDPMIASIKGFYHWKLLEREAALALWSAHVEKSALAKIGILWTKDEATAASLGNPPTRDPYLDLLLLTESVKRGDTQYSEAEKLIDNLFAKAH
ncbi:MAG: hypothetical protein ACON4O_01830 [Lentimonas sp.]